MSNALETVVVCVSVQKAPDHLEPDDSNLEPLFLPCLDPFYRIFLILAKLFSGSCLLGMKGVGGDRWHKASFSRQGTELLRSKLSQIKV